MKNKMQDVRNHLVAMMEALGSDEVDPVMLDRARTTSMLANSYVQTVRCELDALKLYDETNLIPSAVRSDPDLKLVANAR